MNFLGTTFVFGTQFSFYFHKIFILLAKDGKIMEVYILVTYPSVMQIIFKKFGYIITQHLDLVPGMLCVIFV